MTGDITCARYTTCDTSGKVRYRKGLPHGRNAALPPSLEDVMLGPKQGGTEVYFIRHADALPDAAEVVLGHYDEQSLSELGRSRRRRSRRD